MTKFFLQSSLAIMFTFVAMTDLSAQCQQHRQYIQPVYNPPIYSQPIYQPPVYQQPVYQQPYVVTSPQPVRTVTSAEMARIYTTEAKSMFKRGEYQLAKKKLDEVVTRVPKDGNAYQFRALAAFAAANYDDAAADAYDALGLGNAWTRPVIQSLYGDNLEKYQTHVDTLKRTVAQKPTMQSHFLLAYHHVMSEQWADGKVQLQKVLELQPEETLSQKLLVVVEQQLAAQSAQTR